MATTWIPRLFRRMSRRRELYLFLPLLLSLWLPGGCASPSPQCERSLRPINSPGTAVVDALMPARPAEAAATAGKAHGRRPERSATRVPGRP